MLKNLKHKAVELERFHWDKEKALLTAEDSDLRNRAFDGTYPWLVQLYSDACDRGVVIRSTKTGTIHIFVLDESKGQNEDYSGGHDSWYFTPVDVHCPIKQVIIFND